MHVEMAKRSRKILLQNNSTLSYVLQPLLYWEHTKYSSSFSVQRCAFLCFSFSRSKAIQKQVQINCARSHSLWTAIQALAKNLAATKRIRWCEFNAKYTALRFTIFRSLSLSRFHSYSHRILPLLSCSWPKSVKISVRIFSRDPCMRGRVICFIVAFQVFLLASHDTYFVYLTKMNLSTA